MMRKKFGSDSHFWLELDGARTKCYAIICLSKQISGKPFYAL